MKHGASALVLIAVFATGLMFVVLLDWALGLVGIYALAFLGFFFMLRGSYRWARRRSTG